MNSRGLVFIIVLGVMACSAAISGQLRIAVTAGPDTPSSGRLILFARPVKPGEATPEAIDTDEFSDKDVFVASREFTAIQAGQSLVLDGRDTAWPASMDQLAAGTYWMQAVLDADHSYAYSGRGEGDAVSKVVKVTLPADNERAGLALEAPLATLSYWEFPGGHKVYSPEDKPYVDAHIIPIDFTSARLSAFWGRRIGMKGLVVTPPDYDKGRERYPVVYYTTGFGAGMRSLADTAVSVMKQMRDGRYPPMIWVFLDQSSPTGTHEFADSVNNGPWGAALTGELIPWLDGQYRTDARASGRFLLGHSSGGWAVLWLQTTYPKLFGGGWATSPDFSDFKHFSGMDITASGAAMKTLNFARIEAVLGEYGGQLSSFEWVFSPRRADGRPMPLYDRDTGVVDPLVAAYWYAHYDIARMVRERSKVLKPDLDGKVHVIVGTKDDYGLDKAARFLETAFLEAGIEAQFTYIPDKGHYNLYAEGDERMALRRHIVWQMWRSARPDSRRKDPASQTSP